MSPSAPLPTDLAALSAARDAAVVCDVGPLAVLAIGGADAANFLQGQLSNDINALAPNACQHTSFNSPKGRMLANFVLWKEGDTDFRALVPADIAEPVRKRLSVYVLRSKVSLTDVSAETVRLGVGGPTAADALRDAFGVVPATFALARQGAISLLGLPGPRFVVIVPASMGVATREALSRHATAAQFSVWQWLTIRAGIPVVTSATQDAFVAQSANWDLLSGLNFQKGCYTGQEIIARMQYLGRQKERLYVFHAETAEIAAGARLYGATFGDQPCGTVVNAAPAPAGGSDLLAVVQIEAAASGDLRIDAPNGSVLAPLPLPYAIPVPEAPPGRARPAS
jgi:folate-binding protein YgfZ